MPNDDRLADLAVLQLQTHDEDVLKSNEVAKVLGQEDVLGAPALVGRVRLQPGIES
jgi:hypothetical protein